MDDSPVILQKLGCDVSKTSDVYIGDTDAGEITFWGKVTECDVSVSIARVRVEWRGGGNEGGSPGNP